MQRGTAISEAKQTAVRALGGHVALGRHSDFISFPTPITRDGGAQEGCSGGELLAMPAVEPEA